MSEPNADQIHLLKMLKVRVTEEGNGGARTVTTGAQLKLHDPLGALVKTPGESPIGRGTEEHGFESGLKRNQRED